MVKTNKRRPGVKHKSRHGSSKSFQDGGDTLDVMNSARRKLKGALQDLMPHTDDDSSSDEDNRHHWNSAAIKRARRDLGGSSARQRQMGSSAEKATAAEGFKNSFIMKLFDRTVDLSNYTESTPLYPICRAWIANSSLYNCNRKSEELKEEVNNSLEESCDASGDILSLPPPTCRMEAGEKLRVPKPIAYKTDYPQREGEEGSEVASREELLADNLAHWTKVSNSWKQASKLNEQRYANSITILTDMFYK